MKEAKKVLRATVRRAAADRMAEVGRTAADRTAEVGRTADGNVVGNVAAERIEQLPQFVAARTVALYHSLHGEAPTAEMLRRWQGVKRLALPVVVGGGEMVFREYTGEEGLGDGAFGIAEPVAGCEIDPAEIDMMIVPGVAFDTAGRRLGRGGGFYDRYLSQPAAAHIYKVGLSLPWALVAEVPAEDHDVAMDEVVICR